ncbi:hypothetical protein [Amycolatopsis sp. NPDC021455]|uniref:hypothetical protein n=1 Tax=Amycolatopsis sp. NPDC021455 TaxID=3154901 RepID=UPI0033DE07F8
MTISPPPGTAEPARAASPLTISDQGAFWVGAGRKPTEAGTAAEAAMHVQRAFTDAAVHELGVDPEEPIPSDEDVWQTLRAPGAQVLHVTREDRAVGGMVVSIDEHTRAELVGFLLRGRRPARPGDGGPGLACCRGEVPGNAGVDHPYALLRAAEHPFLCEQVRLRDRGVLPPRSPGPHDHPASPGDSPDGDGTDHMFRFEKVMSPQRCR